MAPAITGRGLVCIRHMARPYRRSSSKTYTVSMLAAFGSRELAGVGLVLRVLQQRAGRAGGQEVDVRVNLLGVEEDTRQRRRQVEGRVIGGAVCSLLDDGFGGLAIERRFSSAKRR